MVSSFPFVGKVDSSLGSDPKRGSWEHLVLTKTGDPKNVTLYVNGEKNGSGTWTETLPAGMMDLLIGEHKNPNDMSRFQGKIDELCVFDSALTEQQVKQLYASYGDITIATSSRAMSKLRKSFTTTPLPRTLPSTSLSRSLSTRRMLP